jgi:hypothetical protein
VLRIAVDVADAPVFEMHANPTPARTHVAGGGFDFIARGAIEFEMLVGHTFVRHPGMERPGSGAIDQN